MNLRPHSACFSYNLLISEIAKRRIVDQILSRLSRSVPGIAILSEPSNATRNYGYFPVLVSREYSLTRDGLYQSLRQAGIHARRYFYPLISDMPMYRGLNSANPANLSMAKKWLSR